MGILSDEIRDRIRAYIPRYPSKQAVTLPALHVVHDELRGGPGGAVGETAELLARPPAEVKDTMPFYQFFRAEDDKLGKPRLWVCRTLACALRGADDLLEHCSKKLGVP